ncbi:MAG: hypothetical protein R3A48_16630 [Polyangiales bacterium]
MRFRDSIPPPHQTPSRAAPPSVLRRLPLRPAPAAPLALRVILALCAAAATSTWESRASAQTRGSAARVGIGPFEGERAALTRAMVQSVFTEHQGEIELLPATEVLAAANREGVASSADEAAARALGRALRLEFVVVGTVERRGSGYYLRARVLRGSDGGSAGSASWEFERLEEIEALRGEIWSQLSPSLRARGGARPATSSQGTRIDDGARAPTTPPASGASTDEPERASPGGPPGYGLGWLHIAAQGGIAGRSWRVPVLGERTARGYQNGLYGELGLTATALVTRFNQNHMGFGFELGLRLPVGLSSQGRDADGRVVALSTTSFEVFVGPTLMFRPAGGGLVRFAAGFVYHQFDLDTSRLAPEMRLAPVTYLGLRLAGEALLPFVARPDLEFGVLVGGELRVVAAGAEMREAFGQNPDTTTGLGVLLGLGARLDRAAPGLGLRLTAEWLRYRTPFAGPGRIGTGSDSVDDYTRYQLAVTYTFGADRAPRRSEPARDAWTGSSSAPSSDAPPESTQPETTRSEGDPFAR